MDLDEAMQSRPFSRKDRRRKIKAFEGQGGWVGRDRSHECFDRIRQCPFYNENAESKAELPREAPKSVRHWSGNCPEPLELFRMMVFPPHHAGP
jgi:hypothetical protein